jgi:DNA-binding LacI/PurR family transcriptional regulator
VRRRVTSADVAHHAGVSRTTVSFVLNERPDTNITPETRKRVLDAARDLGYVVHGAARALAAGSSQTIGLVLRQSPEQVAADALLAETLWGIGGEVHRAGYRVLVEPLSPGVGTYSGLVRSQRVDGLIVSGPRSDDLELRALADEDYPIILQGSLPGINAPSVDVDNRAGARSAVEHLVALGHTRIACITNAPRAYTSAEDRLAGYRDALEAAGVAFDDAAIAEGAFDAASGLAAMRDILGRGEPPTAVFVCSDVVAVGALRALREAGLRVPDDVSVAGFDDIALAPFVEPPLTTVRLPARALGVAAGRALVERLAGRMPVDRHLLATELVVRASTAAPRRSAPTARRPRAGSPPG